MWKQGVADSDAEATGFPVADFVLWLDWERAEGCLGKLEGLPDPEQSNLLRGSHGYQVALLNQSHCHEVVHVAVRRTGIHTGMRWSSVWG